MPDKYQFFIEGSTYRHTLLTAVSYWAEGDVDTVAAELAKGEAVGEWKFMTQLRDHAKFLRSLRDDTESEMDSRCYDLIVAMLDALNAGEADRQIATALDAPK